MEHLESSVVGSDDSSSSCLTGGQAEEFPYPVPETGSDQGHYVSLPKGTKQREQSPAEGVIREPVMIVSPSETNLNSGK